MGNILPNGNNSLYQPLQPNEIRLVTIRPRRQRRLLSCDLDTVSLLDKTASYQQFLRCYGGPKAPRRWLVSTWNSMQAMKAPVPPSARTTGSAMRPLPIARRFNWGDYAALSYAWGTERGSYILVNGEILEVSRNLEEALEELRSSFSQSTYGIWIDALCINQNDPQETIEQVSRMRDVYSQAWSVIAWLGPAADCSRQGFGLLSSLARLHSDERDALCSILEKRPGHFGTSAFFGLSKIMTREYWDRLWIIQELVLGSQSTIVRCGNDALDWTTFCRGIATLYHGGLWATKDWLLEREMLHRGITDDPRWQTPSIHLVNQNLRPLSAFEVTGGERQHIRKLLELSVSDCSVEKDKVFGLLGMMESSIIERLIPMYSKSTEEIFTITTAAFIDAYGNLEPLREARIWGLALLPSWVVDWTWDGRIRYSNPETTFIGAFWDSQAPEPRPDMLYSADTGRSAVYNICLNARVLKCRGVIVDRVCGLGACGRGYFDMELSSVIEPVSWSPAYADVKWSLCDALVMGRVSNGEQATKRNMALLHLPRTFESAAAQFEAHNWPWMKEQMAYYFRWVEWHRTHGHIRIGDCAIGDLFTDSIPPNAAEFDYAESFIAADRAPMARRFMFTEKGYFGWAPDNAYGPLDEQAEIGDVVCIVYGCSTPLLIRPNNGMWQVIGEAYLEGWMDGQLAEHMDAGELCEQELAFC